jgi:hypothetical protein
MLAQGSGDMQAEGVCLPEELEQGRGFGPASQFK